MHRTQVPHLHFDFSRLLKRFLLDERHLSLCNKRVRERGENEKVIMDIAQWIPLTNHLLHLVENFIVVQCSNRSHVWIKSIYDSWLVGGYVQRVCNLMTQQWW